MSDTTQSDEDRKAAQDRRARTLEAVFPYAAAALVLSIIYARDILTVWTGWMGGNPWPWAAGYGICVLSAIGAVGWIFRRGAFFEWHWPTTICLTLFTLAALPWLVLDVLPVLPAFPGNRIIYGWGLAILWLATALWLMNRMHRQAKDIADKIWANDISKRGQQTPPENGQPSPPGSS